MTNLEIKAGKDLTPNELEVINLGRKTAFGSEDLIEPRPENVDWLASFFILNDESKKILVFAKLHQIKVVFQDVTYPTLCISTLVSLDRGKGYGCSLLQDVRRYLGEQNQTAFAFCESELIPFYKKCGFEVLAREENKFYYLQKNGRIISNPNIVPGEVVVVRGKDGLMEKVLASTDKRVGVID